MYQLTEEERAKAKQLIRQFLDQQGKDYPEIVLQTLPKIYNLLDQHGLCKWDYGTFEHEAVLAMNNYKVQDIFRSGFQQQQDDLARMAEQLAQQTKAAQSANDRVNRK